MDIDAYNGISCCSLSLSHVPFCPFIVHKAGDPLGTRNEPRLTGGFVARRVNGALHG